MSRREAPSWEVIPSVSLEAGRAVAELLGSTSFVIEINTEAASAALQDLQDKKAKPGLVHFFIEKNLDETLATPDKITLGTTKHNKDNSSTIKLSLFDTSEAEPKLLTRSRLQRSAVHELKHAADFTVRSLRRADRRFYKKAVRDFEAKITMAFRVSDYAIASSMNQGLELVDFHEEDMQIKEATNEFIRKMSEESPLELRVQGIDHLAYDQIVKVVR